MGLSVQNSVANQQYIQSIVNANLQNGLTIAQNAMQNGMQIAQAVTVRSLRMALDTSAEEAVAFTKQIGSDIQDKLTNLEATLSAAQQFEKTALTSPPQTGTGGAFGSDSGSALAQQLANMQALLSDLSARLATAKIA